MDRRDGMAQAPVVEVFAMAAILSAGGFQSIARRRDGTVWTWGSNQTGQLGLGDPATTLRRVPTLVPNVTNARDVVAGFATSFILATDGFVQACGWHEGRQLGRPATVSQFPFLPVQRFRRPRAVAAGPFHCLATYKGQVYAWGTNRYGGFGLGAALTVWIYPRPLPGVSGVTQAACGGMGQSFLLRRAGARLLVAGRNNFGQLGDGTTQDRTEFTAIPDLSDVTAISGGSEFTLGLRDDGTVWAWGRNHVGQLGDGTRVDRPSPGRVGRLRRIVAIAAGGAHGLALDDSGRVSGWGSNATAELGADGTGALDRPVPAKIALPRPIVAIAAGSAHSLAVDDNGDVWGWGSNHLGQVGVGSPAQRIDVPTRLTGISQVG